ncbi:MAG: YhjD/YihY/BrkB family envelope integrity protein [Gammaproteobacteria bacterium]
MIPQWLARLRETLWGEHEALSRFQHELRQSGRYLYALSRDLLDGQISMRAMSLVYTTLLSLVPLLALAFSLLKGVGAHNNLEPVLKEFLAPLGPQGADLARNIVAFVENIKVGVLGSLGVVLLIYTVLSMIQKIEDAFNYSWRVETRRRLGQRIGEYLSLLLVGPVAIFAALGMTATVMSSGFVAKVAQIEPVGAMLYVLGRLIPYLVIVGLFTFLYMFIPNTRVKLRAAFGGGLLAGFLWQSASLGFASFVANSPDYNVIYSGFAIVILALIWLYVGWLILLVGCQLAYYLQYPERLTPTRIAPQMWGRATELLGLQIVGMVGRRFLGGEPPLTREQLHRDLPAIPDHVERVVEVLLHHGVLAESGVEGRQLLPKRDLDSLTLAQLWQLLREGIDGRPRGAVDPGAQALVDAAEAGFAQSNGRQTIKEWLAPKG